MTNVITRLHATGQLPVTAIADTESGGLTAAAYPVLGTPAFAVPFTAKAFSAGIAFGAATVAAYDAGAGK
ncbi:hypothetical protein B7C62_20555 [Kitasatospora albolonga]|uniref:Uncharacterized protein n=1 Tax=Kitasatospora albolonga TaxID=68173 RepID=A0ABC8BVJ3_9ACTN|nr:hypothetical protein B7C62_20555 [Kitasatospora albolonga]